MKRIAIAAALALALALTPVLAGAQNLTQAQVLSFGGQKLYDLIGGINGAATQRGVAQFKKAGLSYQKDLTVPTEGLIQCKDPEQLRLLMGAYLFDANYATVFGKKQELLAVKQLMENQMLDALKLRGKVRQVKLTTDELKEISDDPNSMVAWGIIVRNAMANTDLWIRAAQSDPVAMEVLVDGMYGATLQGLYVACKLGLAAGPGEKLVELFNEQARRMEKTKEAIAAFADEPELAKLVNAGPRREFLTTVQGLLKNKQGNLSAADLQQILSQVEPRRAEFVQPCP